ncbi:MAG TPA: response regulator transcription factor [Bacteroidales bacterium]|nr:response regulator transcription factor [Bacteroidales bacterium]
MTVGKKILIVEDEKRLADILKTGFDENGFAVEIAYDGYIGKEMFSKNKYDLVILDINLPLINGYELCKAIRIVNNNVPIIMLTAMGAAENKLTGFEVGADDYVTKPFNFKELLARVRVFLKRSSTIEVVNDEMIQIDDLIINTSKKTVFRGNTQIELTAKEYSLLAYLAKNKGIVISRTDIAEKIWGLKFDTGTNYIDVYINYLRRKIDYGFSNKLIHTRVGLGYVLKNENE